MRTTTEPKSWACFAFYGPKLKQDWVTEKLGISPDFSSVPPHEPVWQLNSRLPASESLNNHLWDILKRIAPIRKEIKEVSEYTQASLYATVEFASEYTKGLRLERRLLLLLGELGIDLELYPWDGRRL